MTEIRGYVEQVTREGVRGWAYDADAPARAPLIEILVDGRPVAVGTTDQPRPDLAHLNLGRDTFGFQIGLPGGVRVEIHRLSARIAGSGEPLAMLDDAGQYEGFVELFDGGSLRGWAWRCGYPEERVRVRVRHQGELVGSSLANQLRPDLIGAGVGDGRHAFLIALPVVQKRLDPAQLYAEFEATGAPLTDLRYPDRKPPPPPAAAAPPSPAPVAAPSPQSVAPPPAAPPKTPIAARAPMSRMPMARAVKAPMPGAPAASARPVPRRPITPPLATEVASRPIAPAAAPPVQPASPPVAQPPAPPPVPTPPSPAAAPPPQPTVSAPPAPTPPAPQAWQLAPEPAPVISKELYEALRGSLNLGGDEDGLF